MLDVPEWDSIEVDLGHQELGFRPRQVKSRGKRHMVRPVPTERVAIFRNIPHQRRSEAMFRNSQSNNDNPKPILFLDIFNQIMTIQNQTLF